MRYIALAFLILSCGPASEVLIGITSGTPDRDATCAVNLAQACHNKVPVICHANDHRWWPMLQRRPDGTQRECVTACVVENGEAFCAGE